MRDGRRVFGRGVLLLKGAHLALTRRDFVRRVGVTGGVGAAHVAMQALGFAPVNLAYAGPPRLPAASGHGTRVAILGAGIAGLTAAWELGKAGYEVTVLEARDRVGGRNWTLRRGTRLDLTDGTSQLCDFDEGLYFNAGPARLPSHHQAILGYCREFGVELEVEVNSNRSSLLQNDAANGGKPIQQRQAINDTRGHVSELLAKAVGQGALDKDVSADDKERLVAFLRAYGDLSPDLAYKGSTRSGYTTLPGAADQAGTARDPLDLHLLLDADLWNGVLFEDAFVMQATMFQPVGGMDRIPAAFEKRLAGKIRNGAMVREIRQTASGVRIVHADARSGKVAALEADYCVCTIPLPVLKDIPADFSPGTKAAIAGIAYDHACKVAWQSRRFWETEAQIYGGISFLKRPTNLVWYPSGGFHKPEGVLIGCYNTGEDAARFAAQPLAAQFATSRDSVERLHPGKGGELRKPIAIAWHKVEHNLGPWVHWPEDKDAEYALLSRPDGRIYLAGEHLSHVTAWQEGAALSAQHVVREIAARVAAPQ